MDIDRIRKLFPLTKNYIFLNNAAESPLNLKVKDEINNYLDFTLNEPHNKPLVRTDIKVMLSKLFGGSPEEYALITSTGIGLNITAKGYEWEKGDNIIVPSNEHWNNKFPWESLKGKGVIVKFVSPDKDNKINPKDIEALIDEKTKIVSIAAVSFNTGFRADLKAISKIAHDNGALFVVDGIQGAGVAPINVQKDHIDIFSSAGFKWLLGVPGTGFLYVNKKIQNKISPILPGMFSADLKSQDLNYHKDARKYETGSIPYSLFYGWKEGLEIIDEIGVENIYKRILYLTDKLILGLKEKNIKILSPIKNIRDRSAILIFTMGSLDINKNLVQNLLKEKIVVTLRDGFIRVSPSFYNTEAEIDKFLSFL